MEIRRLKEADINPIAIGIINPAFLLTNRNFTHLVSSW